MPHRLIIILSPT